jgi:hypothetical protein
MKKARKNGQINLSSLNGYFETAVLSPDKQRTKAGGETIYPPAFVLA